MTAQATIESSVLGTLERSADFEDWWQSPPVAVSFLSGLELAVTLMGYLPASDPAFLSEADAAVSAFLAKGEAQRALAAPLVLANYEDFRDALGEIDWMPEPSVDDIWDYVQAQGIYVERRHRRDEDVYLTLACECDWEEEHGLQLVFRRGVTLTRVSPEDGHLTEADAFDKPDEQDELLSRS